MTWLTARQLAGLPGMPTSERRTRDKLLKLGVPSRVRAGREGGGGLEYDASALPTETRQALMLERIAAPVSALAATREVASAPAQELLPAVPKVSGGARPMPSLQERAVADARLILVSRVRDLAHINGTTKACKLLALQLATGECDPSVLEAARTANQRARSAAVGERTLFRWLGQHQESGWHGLLPAPVTTTPLAEVDDDVAMVLSKYHSRDARFRSLTDAAKYVTRQLGVDFDSWRALYDRARRALAKVDNVQLIKARHSGSQRAAKLPFRRRSTDDLRPLDVCLVDGHTFKAKVRHPDHGAPFAPEVTLVIDASTKMVCGWSASLSENTIAVGDAMRHAVGNVGVFAIVYSDNGAGETAKVFDCPVDGIMRRLGSDHRTGFPGHPQARGLIERSWRTHMIKVAREFPTFQGSDVDDGTLRKVSAELAKEQRAVRRARTTGEVVTLSPKCPSWQQFLEAVERGIHEYNTTHRHRSLPKREDGKRMTPAEAWAATFDPELQHRMDPQELRMTFMPAKMRVAKRGEVVLFNQHYQAGDLMQRDVDGQPVSVRYDIHDPSYVLVYTRDGRFVCEARWNANTAGFFPKAVIEQAREKRVHAAVKRLEQQIDLALRELNPTVQPEPLFLPEPGTPDVLVPTFEARSSFSSSSLPELPPSPEVAAQAAGRPFFDTPSDRYEWLLANRGEWTDDDDAWLRQYVRGEDYRELAEYYAERGLAWDDGSGAVFKGAR